MLAAVNLCSHVFCVKFAEMRLDTATNFVNSSHSRRILSRLQYCAGDKVLHPWPAVACILTMSKEECDRVRLPQSPAVFWVVDGNIVNWRCENVDFRITVAFA